MLRKFIHFNPSGNSSARNDDNDDDDDDDDDDVDVDNEDAALDDEDPDENEGSLSNLYRAFTDEMRILKSVIESKFSLYPGGSLGRWSK